MGKFEFNVNIQAKSNSEAKEILTALFDIKKSLSTKDLKVFAKAVKEKPHLIKKLKCLFNNG